MSDRETPGPPVPNQTNLPRKTPVLNIRLARAGRKRDAHFRVVVSDSVHGRVGRILETVGHYHPRLPNDAEGRIHLDRSRTRYWLDRGARPSDTVRSFLKNLPEPSAEDPAAEAAAPTGTAVPESAETAAAESAETAPGTPTETPAETQAETPAETPSAAASSGPPPEAPSAPEPG